MTTGTLPIPHLLQQAYPITVTELQNPVTRFVVRVEPPIEVCSAEEWDSVCVKFTAYCVVAWQDPIRLSPETIHASWLRYIPAPPGAAAEPE